MERLVQKRLKITSINSYRNRPDWDAILWMERRIHRTASTPMCKNLTVSDRCEAKAAPCRSHSSYRRKAAGSRCNTKRASKALTARCRCEKLRRSSPQTSFMSRKFRLLHPRKESMRRRRPSMMLWRPGRRPRPSAKFRTREASKRAITATCSCKIPSQRTMSWAVPRKSKMTWWQQVPAIRESRLPRITRTPWSLSWTTCQWNLKNKMKWSRISRLWKVSKMKAEIHRRQDSSSSNHRASSRSFWRGRTRRRTKSRKRNPNRSPMSQSPTFPFKSLCSKSRPRGWKKRSACGRSETLWHSQWSFNDAVRSLRRSRLSIWWTKV